MININTTIAIESCRFCLRPKLMFFRSLITFGLSRSGVANNAVWELINYTQELKITLRSRRKRHQLFQN